MMYRPVLELENPGIKVKSIRMSRYIPGSRFPDGWDQKTEERVYDAEGRLTLFRRFDGYTGAMISEKKISYDNEGQRLTERTFKKETNTVEVLKFQNQYTAEGMLFNSVVTDSSGKQVGRITRMEDGNLSTELGIGPTGKLLLMVHDGKGKLIKMVDQASQLTELYNYDSAGELASIDRTRAGKRTLLQYSTTRDSLNRVLTQKETSAEGSRVMEFKYDDKGRLVSRNWVGGKPAETYGYGNGNQLKDIMQYTPEGHPREVTAIFTERYR
jgi:YD repeat-containing protein